RWDSTRSCSSPATPSPSTRPRPTVIATSRESRPSASGSSSSNESRYGWELMSQTIGTPANDDAIAALRGVLSAIVDTPGEGFPAVDTAEMLAGLRERLRARHPDLSTLDSLASRLPQTIDLAALRRLL